MPWSKTSNALSVIANMTNLYFLNLQGNRINDTKIIEFGNALKKLTKLEYLYISSMEGEKSPEFIIIAEALANMQDLVQLGINNSSFVDIVKIEIAKSLRFTTKLKSLEIQNCKFSEEATEILGNNLKNMHALEDLYLVDNDLSFAGAKSIGDALEDKIKLKILFIGDSKMTLNGGLEFAKAFNNKPNLSMLGLDKVFDQSENIASNIIFESLSNAPNVNELIIKNMSIVDESVDSIGKSLSKMKNLNVLILDSNQITAYGAKIILHSLKNHLKLAKISLEDNIVNGEENSSIFLKSDAIINNDLKQKTETRIVWTPMAFEDQPIKYLEFKNWERLSAYESTR